MAVNLANKLLGYPDDARLLIINADDYGMCHAINDAIFQGFAVGVVHSTSLMMTCPWAWHSVNVLRENPDMDFGVHLTMISDMPDCGWKPLTCPEKIPSLVNERGVFHPNSRQKEAVAGANIREVEIEFRAQIEAVLAEGLKPSKLDWHCLYEGGSAAIFDLTLGLAKEYGMAMRVTDRKNIEPLQSQGLPTNEAQMMDSYNMPTDNKTEQYLEMLHNLPAGLTEWAVHPGTDANELRTLEPGSWQVRHTDYGAVMSPDLRAAIEREGIILINYRPLQKVWQAKR